VLGIFEDVEKMAFWHAVADFLFELHQPFGLASGRQLLQMRCTVRVDAQFTVVRESGINLGCHLSGSGSIMPVTQSSRLIHSLTVWGVAGPGACLRRLKLAVVLLGGLISKESSTALCPTVRREATRS
jgi:hypothetical protein